MEKKNLNYKIKFYSDWHCGSGQSSGADSDSIVIKDENRLPYIPGRTIKGLLKDAIEINPILSQNNLYSKEIFGTERNFIAMTFFSNACLSEIDANTIIKNKLTPYLYRKIASTKIDANGVAEGQSLRKIEVVIPLELTGKILNVPMESVDILCKAAKFIKRIGYNRNRGLGRCDIIITEN